MQASAISTPMQATASSSKTAIAEGSVALRMYWRRLCSPFCAHTALAAR